MLVLTRKTSESIVIGNDITVTVLEVRGDQVRIGIDAPRSVQVHREEIYQQVAAENAAAVQTGLGDKQRALLRRRLPGAPPRPIKQDGPIKQEGTGAPKPAPRRPADDDA